MVLSQEDYEIAAWTLVALGVLVSILSALERRVRWVQRFCAFFGEGCRRTAVFTLFRVPVPIWGLAYYAGLGLVLAFDRPLMFWAVMAGLGIEFTFVLTMVLIRALCVFCLLNSIIVALLLVLTFNVRHAELGLALAAAAFVGSFGALFYENRPHFERAPKDEVLSEIEREAETGLNPALGREDAPVKVIEFSDYLCPHCRKVQPAAERIRREYKDLVRWVYVDFPLEMHPGAKDLARAPRCARDQGKFWEFHELVLAEEGEPGSARLEALAGRVGLDVKRFRACMAGTSHADEIERDIAEGLAARISATPTFLVNGRPLVAPSYDELKSAIDRALALARQPSS